MVLLANQEPYVVILPSDSRLDMHKARTASRRFLAHHHQQQQQPLPPCMANCTACPMNFSHEPSNRQNLRQQLPYDPRHYHQHHQQQQQLHSERFTALLLPQRPQLLQLQQQEQRGLYSRRRDQQQQQVPLTRLAKAPCPVLFCRCQTAVARLVI